jgi:hypothetical protein
MSHSGKYCRAIVISVAALAAGVLAAAAPAGTALASPAAASAASYSFNAETSGIKALGHTWSLEVADVNGSVGGVEVEFWTQSKGATENHLWMTSASFSATAAKDLTVTSAAHATFKTGTALRPILTASLAFTPVKSSKASCAKGGSTSYAGYVTGTVTLVSGLRSVKVSVKFSKKSVDADLTVDKSCVPPPVKPLCGGSGWDIIPAGNGDVLSEQETLGAKTSWDESFDQAGVKTASKWFTREDGMYVDGGSVPKLNTKARTITVAMIASSAITGSGVISYTMTTPLPAMTCYVGSKRYSETGVVYYGTAKASKPFQAHTTLTGTLTVKPAHAIYTGYTLKAK